VACWALLTVIIYAMSGEIAKVMGYF